MKTSCDGETRVSARALPASAPQSANLVDYNCRGGPLWPPHWFAGTLSIGKMGRPRRTAPTVVVHRVRILSGQSHESIELAGAHLERVRVGDRLATLNQLLTEVDSVHIRIVRQH